MFAVFTFRYPCKVHWVFHNDEYVHVHTIRLGAGPGHGQSEGNLPQFRSIPNSSLYWFKHITALGYATDSDSNSCPMQK